MLGLRRFLIAALSAIFVLFTVVLFVVFKEINQTIIVNYVLLSVVFAFFIASEIMAAYVLKNSALKITFSLVMPAYVAVEIVLVLIFAVITNISHKELHGNVTLFTQLPLFLVAVLFFAYNFSQYGRIGRNQERQKQNKLILDIRRNSIDLDNIPPGEYEAKRLLDNVKLKLSHLPTESLAGLEEVDAQIDNEILNLNGLFASEYDKENIIKQLRKIEQLINKRNMLRTSIRR